MAAHRRALRDRSFPPYLETLRPGVWPLCSRAIPTDPKRRFLWDFPGLYGTVPNIGDDWNLERERNRTQGEMV